jgi:soluble lytic murein transglycosylase-like protein
MSIPYFACMLTIAAHFGLPPRVLPSIQRVEGGQVGMARRNANGTEDLGLMQVNSLWVPRLAQYWGVPEATMRAWLMQDACFNITVAGALVRIYLSESKGDLLAAVRKYHSHTPTIGLAYQAKVAGAARALFDSGASGAKPR